VGEEQEQPGYDCVPEAPGVRAGAAMEVAVQAVRHGLISPTGLLIHLTFGDVERMSARAG